MPPTDLPAPGTEWWRSAVIYQVYVRSFADGNGDGIGDLAGLRERLPYLADLGVDAIWCTPWYPSPMADGGYDVADYRDIHPDFGTLAEAEQLIAEAARLGIGTIVDIVPNHVSDRHPWFAAALAAGPGSAERTRFHFRPGRGPRGEQPPNNWRSQFGGSAWSPVPGDDERPQWYLHRFAPEQPDLNWRHPAVAAEHEQVLRFWLDRGVAGIRIDSAAELVKDPELPDLTDETDPRAHPYVDRDGVHEIYRSWRRIADSYPGRRTLIGEVWLPDTERLARYLRPDELHTVFNFDFLSCPWSADRLRAVIDTTMALHEAAGAPAAWVLANHDVTRTVTRYGRRDTGFDFDADNHSAPADTGLGLRRARAAALLSLALPGTAYLYQGEELGLPQVTDIPADRLADPMYHRSGGTHPGRDGCRVPLPWSGGTPPFGFSTENATGVPWLPQPDGWKELTAEAQAADPASMLTLYRRALRIRRAEPGLGDGPMSWLPAEPDVLAFGRPGGFGCLANLSAVPVTLPEHAEILLTSGDFDAAGRLPTDTAAWLRLR